MKARGFHVLRLAGTTGKTSVDTFLKHSGLDRLKLKRFLLCGVINISVPVHPDCTCTDQRRMRYPHLLVQLQPRRWCQIKAAH